MVPELSLNPIFNYLKKNLKEKIYFYQNGFDDNAIEASNKLVSGEVFYLKIFAFLKKKKMMKNFAKNLQILEIFL